MPDLVVQASDLKLELLHLSLQILGIFQTGHIPLPVEMKISGGDGVHSHCPDSAWSSTLARSPRVPRDHPRTTHIGSSPQPSRHGLSSGESLTSGSRFHLLGHLLLACPSVLYTGLLCTALADQHSSVLSNLTGSIVPDLYGLERLGGGHLEPHPEVGLSPILDRGY